MRTNKNLPAICNVDNGSPVVGTHPMSVLSM